MKRTTTIIILLIPFLVEAQHLPLSAGSSYPLSAPLYHGGNGYVRRSLTPTYFGYHNSYRVLMLGSALNSHTTQEEGSVTVSFGYDPSANTNGAFTGDGREILFRNGAAFTTPNAANNSYHLNNLVLKDGRVGIGIANPEAILHLHKDAVSSPQILIDNPNTYGIRLGVSSDNKGFLGSYNSTPVEVLVGGIPRMYFDVNGKIGVGSLSPAAVLDVQRAEIGSNISITESSDDGYSPALFISRRSRGTNLNNPSPIQNGNYLGGLSIQGFGTSYTEGARIYGVASEQWTGSGNGTDIFFATTANQNTAIETKMVIKNNGSLGIGILNPSEKLSVNGNVKAKKVIVSQTGWPDYVFDSSYSLRSLSEVEKFIIKNKHLPEMPSAKEVEDKGISVGDNQALLLKKIEELTLYIIKMNNENKEMKKQLAIQAEEIKHLKDKQ